MLYTHSWTYTTVHTPEVLALLYVLVNFLFGERLSVSLNTCLSLNTPIRLHCVISTFQTLNKWWSLSGYACATAKWSRKGVFFTRSWLLELLVSSMKLGKQIAERGAFFKSILEMVHFRTF
jgi:hypothetical protein